MLEGALRQVRVSGGEVHHYGTKKLGGDPHNIASLRESLVIGLK